MRNTLSRRSFFALPAALLVVSACKKDPGAPPPPQSTGRCSHCGMKLKPESPWLAELVSDDGQKLTFDAPRCAFAASLAGKKGKLRMQDYYDKKWHDASELRFVAGSSVIGPMGPDLVPVDPARVTKFTQDHEGEKTYEAGQVTQAILDDLK